MSATYSCISGGPTLEEAFASAALGMYNYMTPLSGVGINPACSRCAQTPGSDVLPSEWSA